MGNLDLLFRKSGVSEKDVEQEAEKILKIPNDTPFKRGGHIMEMLSLLSARDIGPGRGDKTKMTTERQLVLSIEEGLNEFCKNNWAKSDWDKSQLIEFLKVYYGLRYYCQNTDMGNEWLRLLQNKEAEEPEESDESKETKH